MFVTPVATSKSLIDVFGESSVIVRTLYFFTHNRSNVTVWHTANGKKTKPPPAQPYRIIYGAFLLATIIASISLIVSCVCLIELYITVHSTTRITSSIITSVLSVSFASANPST